MSNKQTQKRPFGSPRPFPWFCRNCGNRSVSLAMIDYDAEILHDNKLVQFTVKELEIPICTSCGAKVFTEGVDRQINQALRKHLQLLTPEQIREGLLKLGVSKKEVALQLRIGEDIISNWLTGSQIQSTSMDLLLRIYLTFPNVRAVLENEAINSAI